MGENNILEKNFCYEFAKVAGFRNFLAHDYEKVDGGFVCEQILAKLDDIDSFIDQIQLKL